MKTQEIDYPLVKHRGASLSHSLQRTGIYLALNFETSGKVQVSEILEYPGQCEQNTWHGVSHHITARRCFPFLFIHLLQAHSSADFWLFVQFRAPPQWAVHNECATIAVVTLSFS